jgi:Arc/MetJ family transcription regulator
LHPNPDVYRIKILYTGELAMRTNIVIDDKLMDEAIKLTGAKTKKDAVELGLRTIIRLKKQEKLNTYKGKLKWEGNLEEMRTD